MLNKLERRLRRFAVPNVTLFIIGCQVLTYGVGQARPESLDILRLIPRQVLAGEVWRLATFLVEPPQTNLIFACFFWYLFYLTGTALEAQWGAFRYNVFLLIGYVATVAAAFLTPEVAATNSFVQLTVFLAFAQLYPDFVINLFMILPIKIKWLALLQWIGYLVAFSTGDWSTRAAVAASVVNFFVFFGRDVVERIQGGRRRRAWQTKVVVDKEKPFHRCLVCGITDKSHPQMEFRYCSQCAGACGYCSEHIRNHDHVPQATVANQSEG